MVYWGKSLTGASVPLCKPNAGLSLIEMMFSVAILSVALVSVIGGIVTSYEANVITRQRTVAVEQARALLDEVRESRTLGAVVPLGIKELFPDGEQKLVSKVLKAATRTISYSTPAPGVLLVNVDVTWEDMRGRRATVTLSTGLSNYE